MSGTVTHPSEGVYLSKFMAGIASTIIAAAMVAGFGNLWYLNNKIIEIETVQASFQEPDARLQGALSIDVYDADRRTFEAQIAAINRTLSRIDTKLDRIDSQ
jgi:hypothetical protein